MVEFNELNINQDGSILTLDVSIKDLSYYTDVYIDAIIIDTQDTYTEGGPSSSPIYTTTIAPNTKNQRLELDKIDLNVDLNKTLFFIWVITRGTPSLDTPCGEDNYINLGVTYAKYPIYRQAVDSMKELEDECKVPKFFIDTFLRLKAIEFAVLTNNYEMAVKFWQKFFLNKDIDIYSVESNCNCNKT